MLYTKYECSGPCSFGQEDFWKLHFENLFFTLWPTYSTNRNRFNILVGNHTGSIPSEFGKFPISGIGEKVV